MITEAHRHLPAASGPSRLLALLSLVLSAVAATAGEAGDWLFPPFTAAPASLRAGEPAPELRWSRPDGSTGALADLRGQVVVVVFWASWCPWCRRLWPVLREVGEGHPGHPHVLPVNVWDDPAAAAAYAAGDSFGWPLLTAAEGAPERWFVTATPHTVVVDAGGRIAGVVSGFDPEGAAIRAALDLTLEGRGAP